MKTEIARLSPEILIWHCYDASVKVELFSSAILTSDGVAVIDPIELEDSARAELDSLGPIVSILLTNANHARDAQLFAERYGVSVIGAKELREAFPGAKFLDEIPKIHGLDVIPIAGAAPGEFAFYEPCDGGTLVVGDALINFGAHQFSLLPRKYCVDQKRMVISLRQLLDLKFRRVLFAHGEPIVTQARQRLAALLEL